jgi:hypothetical protein
MSHAAPAGLRLGLLMQRWPDEDRPLGAMAPFAQTISELAAGEGVSVLVFAPADAEADRVRALAWRDGRWWEQTAPLPDVIWHRYLGADREQALRRILRLGIPVFNESALSKWEAHQVLQADPILKETLPETRLLQSVDDIADLGRRHAELFLKPVDGAVGRGIIRASFQPTGLVRLQYVAAPAGRLRAEEARLSQLERWVAGHRGRYIVQQGLDLKVFYGRAADLRLLMQKDGSGRWNLTGMGARVAAHGRFTANLHTGGTGVPAGLLAGAVFPDDPERQELLLLELQALAARAAEALEPAAGTLGELGLDFGVDRQGGTWYIEQNALPGRALFEHLSRPDLSRLAHLRPIQYARRLAATKSAKAAGYRAT